MVASFATITKEELHCLADGLTLKDRDAIDKCVDFVLAETRGNWHGRARAMMCRRLKHCEIGKEQAKDLVTCIIGRLTSGNFSEQFDDQLRLAMFLDLQATTEAARRNLAGAVKDHVRRCSLWVLQR